MNYNCSHPTPLEAFTAKAIFIIVYPEAWRPRPVNRRRQIWVLVIVTAIKREKREIISREMTQEHNILSPA